MNTNTITDRLTLPYSFVHRSPPIKQKLTVSSPHLIVNNTPRAFLKFTIVIAEGKPKRKLVNNESVFINTQTNSLFMCST